MYPVSSVGDGKLFNITISVKDENADPSFGLVGDTLIYYKDNGFNFTNLTLLGYPG